ncbi:MADS-box transcription factor [Lyophyllum atratum]|nr:MADS-box transcription factor [Lyophyllum atratum]
MGRRKIEIQPITHERNRSVTFLKRKNGLFKKAYELGVLCSVDVAVIVFEERPGHHLKLYQYGSSDIHDIIQRHLHHDGEKDTRGPSDFSGNASGTKIDDAGEAEEDDVDEDVDDVLPPIRGSKRRGDGHLKQTNDNTMTTDLDYAPARMSLSHPQHAPRQLPQSMSIPHQQHQHPMSSDRLGPMHHHQSNKKPRLGLAPGSGLAHSRSSSDDAMPSSGSPVSGSRSGRYRDLHTTDALGRNFAVSSYIPHHTSQSAHPHPHATNSASHQHHRQHPQYTPFFPSSGPGGYGQGGATPPPPNFIPLQSQSDFTSSARARSASSSSSGVLPQRNVYSYGGDGGPGGGGAGPGASGDLFAAFLDAEQQARAGMPRRNTASAVGGGGPGAFGLDWPVHVPPAATTTGPGGGGDPSSKPGSQTSSELGGERERDGASAGSAVSAGNGNGNGSGNGGPGGGGGNGADWLDFLSGATSNGAAPG